MYTHVLYLEFLSKLKYFALFLCSFEFQIASFLHLSVSFQPYVSDMNVIHERLRGVNVHEVSQKNRLFFPQYPILVRIHLS